MWLVNFCFFRKENHEHHSHSHAQVNVIPGRWSIIEPFHLQRGQVCVTSFRECLDVISGFCFGKKDEHEICSHAHRWMSYRDHEASSARFICDEDKSAWRVFVSLLMWLVVFVSERKRSVKSVRLLRWMSYWGYEASSTWFICNEDKSVWRVFASVLMWLVNFFSEGIMSIKAVHACSQVNVCLTGAMKHHRPGSFVARTSRRDEFSWVSWCD